MAAQVNSGQSQSWADEFVQNAIHRTAIKGLNAYLAKGGGAVTGE